MAVSFGLPKGYKSHRNNIGQLQCQIITDFAKLQALAPDWDSLWRADPRAEAFQCFAWAEAWWQSFGGNFELFTPVVFEGNAVVLILPLVQRHRKLLSLGSPQSDYFDMLCRDICPEEPFAIALQELLKSAPGWDECVLRQLHPDSKIAKASSRLPHALKRLIHLEVTDCCPTIVLEQQKDEILESRLKNKHVRRRLQKLQKAGNVTFHHLENATEVQQQLTQFFGCHRRRCAVLGKRSCFAEPEMQDLIRNLVDKMDLHKELRFGILELNGHPIAWSFGFQLSGKYAYYQQTFDIDAESYAPGDMLLHYLLLYAKQHVEREFDFLRGDEFFKLRVATQVHPIRTLYLESPGIRGNLRRYGRAVQGHWCRVNSQVTSLVRKHETIFQLFRSTRIFTSTEIHHLKQAKRNRQLTKYLLSRLFRLLETGVWSTQQLTLFHSLPDNETVPLARRISDIGTEVKLGQVSDLADLVLQYPEIQFPGFDEYKERLKRGERVHLVQQNGTVVLVAWTRVVRNSSEQKQLSQARSEKPAMEMYECWPIQDSVPHCAQLMSLLASQALKEGADLCICCPEPPSLCVIELKNQSFVPKSRIIAHRICHSLKYDIVARPTSFEQHSLDEGSCPRFLRHERRL